ATVQEAPGKMNLLPSITRLLSLAASPQFDSSRLYVPFSALSWAIGPGVGSGLAGEVWSQAATRPRPAMAARTKSGLRKVMVVSLVVSWSWPEGRVLSTEREPPVFVP